MIADIFSRMNYMERRGSGFKKIKDDYRQAVNYRPELEPRFYSDAASFWVILYNLNYQVPIDGTKKQMFEDGKTVVSEQKPSVEGGKTVVSEQKPSIEGGETVVTDPKQLFENQISKLFISAKTKENMVQLYEQLGTGTIFSRADVMRIIGITSSPAGTLINKLRMADLLQPVAGSGKGKYRFK